MKTRDILAVFNRGRISRRALARTDVGRVALSADIMTNWEPQTLGPMMLRPGLEFKGVCDGDGALIPFIYSASDTALVELTAGKMRVWPSGDGLLSRPSVSTAITNGQFTSDLAGWTDASDAGATSDWLLGRMRLRGTGYTSARRRQQVSVSASDEAVQHALRISVARGSAVLRIGTTAGDDDIFRQAVLRTGTHSIAFTPGVASFWIEFSTPLTYFVLIESVEVESTGTLELPTTWGTPDACKAIRWSQSGDVIYLAAGSGSRPKRIERRPNNSWSIVDYEASDGPFDAANTENITLTSSAISGEVTLTASRPFFDDSKIGQLLRISSRGQLVQGVLSSAPAFTDEIRVTGIDSARDIRVTRTGTWAGSLRLQRSLGAPGAWTDVVTYTSNGSVIYNDALDNSIAYYRIGFDSGDYTSGSATVSLESSSGSITGVARIAGYVSPSQVTAVILKPLGGTGATEIWAEGAWSDEKGWPESVAIWEGRLWWQARGRNYGSVSDALDSFDPDFEGDAGPINRLIGEGAVSVSNWALALQRLVIGTDWAEHSVRSSSFDEPVTPSNYNSKSPSTMGSAAVPAASTSGRGYFVDRTGVGLYELEYRAENADFLSNEMTLLVPDIAGSGFVRIAVQQRPDFRVLCVKSDGTVAMLVRDAAEDVLCWADMETPGASGLIEDVVVLPGRVEDRVFYRVRRTVNGSEVRYLEERAQQSTARGDLSNFIHDSFVSGFGSSVSGLSHLEGQTVVIWAEGKEREPGVVVGGAVAGSGPWVNWSAGLPYTARYKSAKLAGETRLGLSLSQRSIINRIGLILADTHYQGLRFGPDFDTLDDLPIVDNGVETDVDTIWEHYDEDMIEFPGDWSTDNRICLEAAAPRPCTVLAAIMNVDRQDAD